MRGGESFAITRAVFSELYPDGARVQYEGADAEGFREQAERRLGMDRAEDDRWETAREFWCPARVLDVVLYDYSEWRVIQGEPNELRLTVRGAVADSEAVVQF